MRWIPLRIAFRGRTLRYGAGAIAMIACSRTAESQSATNSPPTGYMGATIAICMKSACASSRGGWVVRVDSASPAWDAGLRKGDTVLAVNSIALSKSTADSLLRFLALQKVVLDVRRGREALKLSAITRRR